MEWALGMKFAGGKLMGEVYDPEAGIRLVEPKELVRAGLPEAQSVEKIRTIDSFNRYKEVDSTQYLYHFGIKLSADQHCRHQVFEVTHDNVRLVIPALVIMRSMFRPRNYLFPLAFTPANIDCVSYIDYSKTPYEVVCDELTAGAPGVKRKANVKNPENALRLFQLSKSAKNAIHSVHCYAFQDQLAMHLPSLEFTAEYTGEQVGQRIFVTHLRITEGWIAKKDHLNGKLEHIPIEPNFQSRRRKRRPQMALLC